MPKSTLWALAAAIMLAIFTTYVLLDNRRLSTSGTMLAQELTEQSSNLLAARAETQAVKRENAELRRELSQYTEQQTEISDAVNELQTRLQEVTVDYNNLVETHRETQGRLDAATARQRELARLESAAALAQQKNRELTEELDRQKQLNDRLRQRLQTTSNALTGRSEEVSELENRLQREQRAINALEQQLNELSSERSQAIEQRPDGSTVIQLPELILFDSGSAQLNGQSVNVLRDVARAIESFDRYNIRVIGHSDSLPVVSMRDVYPTNWELSSARASAAVRRLSELGINPKRMSATGVADTQPLAPETDDASRQRNRRIEVVLEPITR